MKKKSFLSKLISPFVWGNLLAMVIVVILLFLGLKIGLDRYTHHNETVTVPDVKQKDVADARHLLESLGLRMEVSDTGYVKMLPSGYVLEQSMTPGSVVKSGRLISVTINSLSTPTLAIPDVIDNSSYREAIAKLTAMGFKVGNPQYVPGEREWVYGITVRGVNVSAGDRVSVDDALVVQVGDGSLSDEDSVQYDDTFFEEDDGFEIIDEY